MERFDKDAIEKLRDAYKKEKGEKSKVYVNSAGELGHSGMEGKESDMLDAWDELCDEVSDYTERLKDGYEDFVKKNAHDGEIISLSYIESHVKELEDKKERMQKILSEMREEEDVYTGAEEEKTKKYLAELTTRIPYVENQIELLEQCIEKTKDVELEERLNPSDKRLEIERNRKKEQFYERITQADACIKKYAQGELIKEIKRRVVDQSTRLEIVCDDIEENIFSHMGVLSDSVEWIDDELSEAYTQDEAILAYKNDLVSIRDNMQDRLEKLSEIAMKLTSIQNGGVEELFS